MVPFWGPPPTEFRQYKGFRWQTLREKFFGHPKNRQKIDPINFQTFLACFSIFGDVAMNSEQFWVDSGTSQALFFDVFLVTSFASFSKLFFHKFQKLKKVKSDQSTAPVHRIRPLSC